METSMLPRDIDELRDLPDYVKLSVQNYGNHARDYTEKSCTKQSQFHELNVSGTPLTYDVKGRALQKRLVSTSIQLSWHLKTYLDNRKNADDPKDSLVWLNPETLSGERAMILLAAQEYCEPMDQWNWEDYLTGEKIDPETWVNTLVDSEKAFMDAFQCGKSWIPDEPTDCPLPLQSRKILFSKNRLS